MSRYATTAAPNFSSTSVADGAHHWRIAEANGPTSLGVCSDCGQARYFRNWLWETDFVMHAEYETAGSLAR